MSTVIQIINGRRVALTSDMTSEQRENAIRAALGAPPIPPPAQHPTLLNVQHNAGGNATAAHIAENQARINAGLPVGVSQQVVQSDEDLLFKES